MNKIGFNILTLRRKKGITQEELAKYVGISAQAVSKWENGGVPDTELLPKIADFFEISIDRLFDRENLQDILEYSVQDIIEDTLSDVVDMAVTSAVQNSFSEALSESLSYFEFTCPDGTKIIPKQQTRVLSPDKTKMLLCYGGLRVDGTTLLVQTRVCSWEYIAIYQSKEEATEALLKIKNAIDNNLSVIEL